MIDKVVRTDCKLAIPFGAKIHLIFHVSQLKKSVNDVVPCTQLPIFLNEEWVFLVQPLEVLNRRWWLNENEHGLPGAY